MFLLKILSEQSNALKNLVDNNKIYTYYSLEVSSNGISTPALKYIYRNEAGDVLTGIIGNEQIRTNIVESNLTGKINNRYIYIHDSNTKTFTLPDITNAINNQIIEVLYGASASGTVIISSATANIASNGTAVDSITLNKYNNKCLLVYSTAKSKWIFYEPFLNNYSYYHELNLNVNTTATNNTRYLVTATDKTIQLPANSTFIDFPNNDNTVKERNNFRISISLECLPTGKVTIESPDSYIQWKSVTDSTTLTFYGSRTKTLLIVWNPSKNTYVVINEVSTNEPVVFTSTNVVASPGCRYVCQNTTTDVTITLPSLDPVTGKAILENTKISIFTEGLTTGRVIIYGNGKTMIFGNTTIPSNDNNIILSVPLVSLTLSFNNNAWHVVELSIPSSTKTKVVDNKTLVENGNSGEWSVNNIYSRLSAGDCLKLGQNTSTGVTSISIDTTGAGNGQVLKFNGNKVVWADDKNDGGGTGDLTADESTLTLGGGTSMSIMPPSAPNWQNKKYALVCINGTIQWMEMTECE